MKTDLAPPLAKSICAFGSCTAEHHARVISLDYYIAFFFGIFRTALSVRLTISKVLLIITFTCITLQDLQQACHFLTKTFEQACASESLQVRWCAIDHRIQLRAPQSSPHSHAMHLRRGEHTETLFLGPLHGKARRFAQAAMGRGRAWWALGVQMSGKGATQELY